MPDCGRQEGVTTIKLFSRTWNWFSKPQPQVWVVVNRPPIPSAHKVVAYREPFLNEWLAVLGPIRSEVDAEEIADRLNIALTGNLSLYDMSRYYQKPSED